MKNNKNIYLLFRNFIESILTDHLYGNTIWLITSTFILSGFGFIFWTLAARFFTVEQMGLGVTLISSMELIVSLSLLGFTVSMIRYMPGTKDKGRMASSCFILSGIAAFILSIIFIFGLNIFSPDLIFIFKNPFYAVIFVLMTTLYTFFIMIEALFIVLRKAKTVALKNLLYSVLKLVFPWFLISYGAFGIYFSLTISAVIAFLFGLFFLPFSFKAVVDLKIISKMFRFGIGNHTASIFAMSPNLLLPLIITKMIGPEQTAYFYIVIMFAGLLYIMPNAISSPLIAESSRDTTKLKQNIKKSFGFVGFFLGLAVIGILVLGKYILYIFGAHFSNNGFHLLQLIAIASVPGSVNILFICIKNVQKRISYVIAVHATRSIGIIGLSILFMHMGLVGIGFAWLITEFSVCLFVLHRIKSEGLLKIKKQDIYEIKRFLTFTNKTKSS